MEKFEADGSISETNIKLKFSEKLSYGLGDLASNLCWCLVNTCLLFFYTDVVKLGMGVVGTIFIVTRVLDAISDPVVGYIADRTKSRWGRFRPYILFGAPLLAICTILCFYAPNAANTYKIIYAYVTYIALSTAYTIINMPYGALAATMTQNVDERSKLSAFRVFFAIVGTLIVSSITYPLVGIFQNNGISNGFFIVSVIYALLSIPLFGLVFKNTKEIVVPQKKNKVTIKLVVKSLLKNKPLLLLMVPMLLSTACLLIRQSMYIYYFSYVVGNATLTSIGLTVMALGMIGGIVLAAPISEKLGDKRMIMLVSIMASGVTCIGMYFTGPDQLVFTYFWIIIGAVFSGMINVMLWSMISDTIEYSEWKTGLRADGVIFSASSFVQKLASALAGWGATVILSIVGYVPNAVQSVKAIEGINIAVTLLPGIVLIISAIPLFFYELNREKFNQIVLEIKQRNQENGGN